MDFDSPESWRWVWLAAMVLFALGEIFVPGTFFMISFALGAAAASITAFLGGGIVLEWVLFVAVSAGSLAVLVPIGRRLDRVHTGPGAGANRWVGQDAVVLAEIPEGVHETGLVRVEREEWRAESADGRAVPSGTRVRVVRVDGTRLVVEAPEPPDRAPAGSDVPGTSGPVPEG